MPIPVLSAPSEMGLLLISDGGETSTSICACGATTHQHMLAIRFGSNRKPQTLQNISLSKLKITENISRCKIKNAHTKNYTYPHST